MSGPGPVNSPDHFEAGTEWSLNLRKQGSLGIHQSWLDGLGQFVVFLVTGFLKISPLMHLNGQC